MVTPVTSRTSPSIEGSPLFELPISTEKVASEVDNEPTTQASASSVTQACASLVGGEAVLGSITRVWNDVMPPSHNITVAQSLLTFSKVVTDVNKELYQCRKRSQLLLLETQLGIAYKELPLLMQLEITNRMLHHGMGIIPTVDIIYHTLPSVELGHSASSVTQACASLVGGEAVLGNITRVWNDVMPPSHNITVAQSLLTFSKVVTDVNKELYQCRKRSQLLLLETQLGIAYKELPLLMQLEITNRMLHHGMGIIPTVDIIYHTLPSVELGRLETELSEGRTDENKLDTLGSMVCIVTSKLETDVTEEFLNARVFAAFNGLSDSLKERIEEKMRNPLHSTEKEGLVDYEGKLSLMIDQQMVSIADPNFTSLVLKIMPRSQRVQAVVLRVRMDLVTRSECDSPKRGFN